MTKQPASPGVGTEASNSAGLGSGVGNNDSPLSQNTPGSIAAPNINYATPPSQHSENTFGGPLRFRTLSDLLDSTDEMQDYEYSGICLLAAYEPGGVEDALEEDCWVKAMNSELKSIQDNNTWHYTNLPKGHKAIGLKWVYKVKRDPKGNVVKHKARLVAKRYAQRHGVDYEEVFAPVARLETVRLILALAASGKWEVHHMDVKSAFLNGELQEEVYVKQPPGFENPRYPGKVLKLQKALYGLKQAPRAWNAKLDQELIRLGFCWSEEEHAVYKRGNGDSLLLLGVYVDDLIICGPNNKYIVEFKQQMCRTFSMSDLGLLSYYLGMEVKQKPGEITLCQKAYAARIIDQCGMTGCNPVDTPMEQNCKLVPGRPDMAKDVTKFRS